MNGFGNIFDAPILRYQGSKYRIAQWIISHFPPHKVYCEPCGGNASVLLNKKPAITEIYNDINSNVVLYFKMLRDKVKNEMLCRQIELTPWARQEYEASLIDCEDDDDLEKCRKLFIRANMSIGCGCEGRGKGFHTIIDKKTYTCANLAKIRNLTPVYRLLPERLQNVIIENRDAIEIIKMYDRKEALFYLDPPYLKFLWKAKKGIYSNIPDDDWHIELLETLKNIKGMAVISGYDNELYNSALKGWKTDQRQTINQTSDKRTEKVWISPKASKRLNNRQGFLWKS